MAYGLRSADTQEGSMSAYSDTGHRPRRRHIVGPLIVLVVMAAFAGGLWYAYQAGRAHAPGEVPLIRAEEGATKTRPEKPGGMSIPDRDMSIYSEGRGQAQVEKLLPPPEAPLPRPAAVAPPTPSPALPAQQATAAEQTPPVPQAAPATPVPAIAAPAPQVVPAPLPSPIAAVPAETAPPAPAPAPAPTALAPALPPVATAPPPRPKPAPAVTGFRLQLVAVRTAEAARAQWGKIKNANHDLLGGLGASWQRADLGARGIFYRLQAGPIADGAKAERICSALRERQITCILVRP
jgi:hypothetical protein